MEDFGLNFAGNGIFDAFGMVIAIITIIFIFGTPVIIVLSILFYKLRKARRLQDTVIKLAEKGVPIPPELFASPLGPNADLRRGVLLIAVGVGLALFLWSVRGPWGLGAIPLLLGAAYLLVWHLDQKKPSA